MRRREFIAGLGSATAWPLAARTQQPERTRRIGALFMFPKDDPVQTSWIAAWREGLEKLGWINGRNVAIDFHYRSGRFRSEFLIVAHQRDSLNRP
jgi:putative tryptophan/tyrosine transport system substrate-binding protein